MTIEKLRPTFTYTEERLRELQAIVPEAFANGKINWEAYGVDFRIVTDKVADWWERGEEQDA